MPPLAGRKARRLSIHSIAVEQLQPSDRDGTGLSATVFDDPADLDDLREAWTDLAVANAAPYCLPEWQLGWWHHAAPPEAELRVIAVFEGEQAIGIAPFASDPASPVTEYRLLASAISAQVQPLARPGRESEVAAAIATQLASISPRPSKVSLTRLPEGSRWPDLLAGAWPGRRPPVIQRAAADSAPSRALVPVDADEFMASLSSNLRSQLRRGRRGFAEKDIQISLAEPDQMESALGALELLHLQRMGDRPTEAMLPGVKEMLEAVGSKLAESGRFRLWVARDGDEAISVFLFLAAGGQVGYWLGAFDDEWRKFSPGLVVLAAAIEDASSRGDDCLDLGPGQQDYKQRFADGEQPLETSVLLPHGPGYARTRARLAPAQARHVLASRLPDAVVTKLRRR